LTKRIYTKDCAMIIDAHCHVFANPRIKYLPDGRPFMSAEEQISIMDTDGIDKAVILPVCNPDVLTEMQGINEILGICETWPDRFIPFCNVDPRLKGSAFYKTDAAHFEFILNQYKQLGCKGLGEICANIFWDDPALLELFKACEKVGFPVTFHTTIADSNDYGLIDDIGFPRFEKVIQRFSSLIFLCHSQAFWSEISGTVTKEDKIGYPTGPVEPGGTIVRLFRRYPNLYGDISAGSGINALMRDPEFGYKFIDEFQDRLLFGLDYCSPADKRPHIRWLTDAKNAGHITAPAYEKIMYKNIAGILNLDIDN